MQTLPSTCLSTACSDHHTSILMYFASAVLILQIFKFATQPLTIRDHLMGSEHSARRIPPTSTRNHATREYLAIKPTHRAPYSPVASRPAARDSRKPDRTWEPASQNAEPTEVGGNDANLPSSNPGSKFIDEADCEKQCKRRYATEISNLKMAHEDAMEKMRQEHLIAISAIKRDHVQALADIEKRSQADLTKLQRKIDEVSRGRDVLRMAICAAHH